jgi:hypothetical protein
MTDDLAIGDRVLYSYTMYGRTVRRTGVIIDIGHERDRMQSYTSERGVKANSPDWVRVKWDRKSARTGVNSRTWVKRTSVRPTTEVIDWEASAPAPVTTPAPNGNTRNTLGVQFNAKQLACFADLGLPIDGVTLRQRDMIVYAYTDLRSEERYLKTAVKEHAKEQTDWTRHSVEYHTDLRDKAKADLDARVTAMRAIAATSATR